MRWLDGITEAVNLGKLQEISEGQGSLVCCSPWGHKESDTTERLRFHFNLEEFHHSVNPAGTCSLNLRGHLLSGCSRRGSVTVQPQTEPRLALTADGLEVPPALCSFSQQFC